MNNENSSPKLSRNFILLLRQFRLNSLVQILSMDHNKWLMLSSRSFNFMTKRKRRKFIHGSVNGIYSYIYSLHNVSHLDINFIEYWFKKLIRAMYTTTWIIILQWSNNGEWWGIFVFTIYSYLYAVLVVFVYCMLYKCASSLQKGNVHFRKFIFGPFSYTYTSSSHVHVQQIRYET